MNNVNYNDLLTAAATVMITFGTIYAIFCVIRMSLKDVIYTRTCEGLDNAQFTVLEQRYYARSGITIIIVGSIVQNIATLWKKISIQNFGIVLGCSILFIISILIIFRKKYKKEKRELECDKN